MAFQAVPDTASITFKFTGGGASKLAGCEAQFTLYVRDTTTAWDAGQLSQLGAYGEAWWETGKNAGTGLKTRFSDNWGLQTIDCVELAVENGRQDTTVVGTTGTLGSDPPPPNCAVLVKFRGDPGNAPPRGWVFVNSGNETSLDGNGWTTAHTDSLVQAFEDFRIDLNDPTAGGDVNWAQVLVSRAAGTEAELALIRDLRVQLKEALRATRRATAETNTLDTIGARTEVASQRDRRASI